MNPSKQVTFQIPKLNGKKRRVTMVKIDKLDSNKRSGISSFFYVPKVWSDDAAIQNIETTEKGSKQKSKMRVLEVEGDKIPEQFMVWLKDLEDKVLKNVVL